MISVDSGNVQRPAGISKCVRAEDRELQDISRYVGSPSRKWIFVKGDETKRSHPCCSLPTVSPIHQGSFQKTASTEFARLVHAGYNRLAPCPSHRVHALAHMK